MPSVNCLDILENDFPKVHAYLREKAGIDFNPESGKGRKEWIQAVKELQHDTLDKLHNVYADLKIGDYKKIEPTTADKEVLGSIENKKPALKLSNKFVNVEAADSAVKEISELGEPNPFNDKQVVIDGVKVNVERDGGKIWLKEITAIEQGKGMGTKVLKQIQDISDKNDIDIVLHPTKIKNTSEEQLIKWYKDNGFEDYTQGRLIYKSKSREVQTENTTGLVPRTESNSSLEEIGDAGTSLKANEQNKPTTDEIKRGVSVIKSQENKAPNIVPLKKANEKDTQEPVKTNEPISTEETKPAKAEPNKTGEAGAVETEQAIPTDEGKQPPISEPPKTSAVFVERPATELSHRGLQDVANEFSLPDVEVRDRKSDVQLRQDAINTANDWAEKGQYVKNVEGLVRKAEGGEVLTDEQRVILERHLANVSNELRDIKDRNSPEFDAKLAEIKRLKDAGEKTRSEAGAALRIPMGGSRPQDIADFLVEEMDVSKVEKLTDKQKEVAIQEFENISDAKKKFDDYMAAKEAEFTAKQATASIEKQKTTSPKTKKTHEEHVEYRKKVIEDIRGKLKKAREESSVTIVPYAKELFAIAPDVGKLVKDLLDEGVSKLEDVVKNIHSQLVEFIPDIKEKDVNDLIAGNYNEKKKTRSELAERAMNLKIEANLINKLDALERGEEPKSEKKKIERNKEITELREKIKNVEAKKTAEANRIKNEQKAAEKAKADAIKEEEKFIREFEKEKDSESKRSAKAKVDEAKKLAASLEKKTKDESVLQSLKTRMTNEIKEIENQIKTGNFEKAVVPVKQPIPLDKEAIDLRDNLIKLRQKRELRLLLQQRQNEGTREKSLRIVAEIANIPRTLMTIADFSGLLRQNLFFSLGHPLMTKEALPGMFKSFTSQKVYDAWFADLKESPRYELIKETKLAIADNLSHDLTKREESFMSSLAEKIPIIGQPLNIKGVKVPGLNIVKGSERSYTMLLNKMRVDVFNYFVDSLENRGVTYENSPKVYKAVAEYVNNATGRSDFGKTLNRISPILNSAFFSPRLIASRINMLTYWAQPRFWNTLPREVRVDYFRNWVSLLAVGGTVLALAKLGGASVEDDPRSSDFGKIKDGNTRWDIWGGAQPYVRVMAQIISGKRKSSTTGKIYKINNKERFLNIPLDFLRNKLAPVPGAGIDIASGETSVGDKIVYVWDTDKRKQVSIREYIQDRIIPMTITGTEEAMKDQGVKSLLTVGVPNAFGVGTQTYESGKKNK